MRVLFIIIIFLSFNLNAETKQSLILSCQSEIHELINKTETKYKKFNQIFTFEILIRNEMNKEKENFTLATIITESVPSCYKYEGSATDSIIKMKCTKDVPELEVLYGEQFLRINRITGTFYKISKSEIGVTTIRGTCKKAEALF
jgi:hypothetical protein